MVLIRISKSTIFYGISRKFLEKYLKTRNNTIMSFRENLRTEMDYQKIKTKQLADKTGINKRTLDGYLATHGYEPTLANAVAIAKALNISVETLARDEDNIFEELTDFPSDITLQNEVSSMNIKYKKLPENQRKIIRDLIDSMVK